MSPHDEARASDNPRRDAIIAVRSAIMLGSSLIATWGVSLVVRLFLPRYLGPELFGIFNFADSFAATFFIVLGMGVDTYIQKEIPVRPERASDFFGGVIAARALGSAAVFALMAAVMAATHRPPQVQRIVFIFGAAQLLVMLNGSLAAMLHAARAVGGLSIVNVASQVLWGVGVAIAVAARLGLPGLALAFFTAEASRAVALSWLARRHLGLRLRFDLAAAKIAIFASVPFYVNHVANTVYAKVDVTLVTMLSNNTEVGWYGAASNVAGLSLLVSPLIGWVLLPLFSRAAARSREELFALVRRAIEVVMLLVLPISLLMGIGADIWVRWLFGRSFAPATLSLRILAPMFVFTYLAMITATCLVLLERAWRVATISLVGLVVNPALNLVLIRWGMRSLGPGGAGVGAATALLLTEAGASIALTAAVGREAFDRKNVSSMGKAVLCCVVVAVVDRALVPLGAARLSLDAVAYIILLFALGAVKLGELLPLARFVLRRAGQHART